jgi:hypothetical protein
VTVADEGVVAIVNSPCTTATPVPERAAVCGELAALSLMTTVPGSDPVAVGEKVTLTVQLAPTSRELPQVVVAE